MKVVCGHFFVCFLWMDAKQMKHVLGKGKKKKPEQLALKLWLYPLW